MHLSSHNSEGRKISWGENNVSFSPFVTIFFLLRRQRVQRMKHLLRSSFLYPPALCLILSTSYFPFKHLFVSPLAAEVWNGSFLISEHLVSKGTKRVVWVRFAVKMESAGVQPSRDRYYSRARWESSPRDSRTGWTSQTTVNHWSRVKQDLVDVGINFPPGTASINHGHSRVRLRIHGSCLLVHEQPAISSSEFSENVYCLIWSPAIMSKMLFKDALKTDF